MRSLRAAPSIVLAMATALLLGLAAPALAQIYRYTGADGSLHFTQNLAEVPADQRESARRAAERPSRAVSYAAPSARPAADRAKRHAGDALRVPFARHGKMMVVQVRINDRVTAPFIVDTGASDVSIPSDVAEQAGIVVGPDTPTVVYQTANGAVASPVVEVDSIEVGDARLERVRAHVSDGMGIGLLGGTFFGNFTLQIDPAASAMVLSLNDRVRSGLTEQQWRERFRQVRARRSAIEHYLEDGELMREARVSELEAGQRAIEAELENLELEANRANVPHEWRR